MQPIKEIVIYDDKDKPDVDGLYMKVKLLPGESDKEKHK
jgi:hypothetical protein